MLTLCLWHPTLLAKWQRCMHLAWACSTDLACCNLQQLMLCKHTHSYHPGATWSLQHLKGFMMAWQLSFCDVGGREENSIDSLVMLWNNDLLNSVNVLFFWSVVGLNVFGLLVTQVLGSVFRAVMLTARTASVSPPGFCTAFAWLHGFCSSYLYGN